jgi:hypothetical protein
MENSTAKTDQDRLGPVLYAYGTGQNIKRICEAWDL